LNAVLAQHALALLARFFRYVLSLTYVLSLNYVLSFALFLKLFAFLSFLFIQVF